MIDTYAPSHPPNSLLISVEQHDALMRLIKIAEGNMPESRRVETFLMALWDRNEPPQDIGIANLWPLFDSVLTDVCTVFQWIAFRRSYLVTTDYARAFENILRRAGHTF